MPLSLRFLRSLLPRAERDEIIHDLHAEFVERAHDGALPARLWLWGQVLRSTIPLARRVVWRGTTGFEPDANRMHPGGPMLESWIMDPRFAGRRMRTRPLYAVLAVTTLALGVGGTAAIFGVGRPLLIDPLPYKDERQLAVFWNTFDWTEQEMLYIRGRVPGFSTVAAWRGEDAPLVIGDSPARLIPGISSSYELFDVLGVRPLLGRGFLPGDDAQNAPPVAVLSYGLWQELGGDPSIIGQRVSISGMRTVIGVMP